MPRVGTQGKTSQLFLLELSIVSVSWGTPQDATPASTCPEPENPIHVSGLYCSARDPTQGSMLATQVALRCSPQPVCLRIFIAVIKHYNQKQVMEERLIQLTLPHHCASSKEIRTANQTGQEPRGRS